MKRKLYMDEFESFIADSADEVRMYPSDKIWRNIDRELHGEKNWPALTFGVILTGAIMLAALIFMHPDKDLFEINPLSPTQKEVAKVSTEAGKSHFEEPRQQANSRLPVSTDRNRQERVEDNNDLSLVATTTGDLTGATLGNSIHLPALLLPANANTLNDENTGTPSQFDNQESGLEPNAALQRLENQASGRDLMMIGVPANQESLASTAAALKPTDPEKRWTADGFTKKDAQDNDAPHTGIDAINRGNTGNRWSMQYYLTPSSSFRILSETKSYNKDLFPGGQIPVSYYNDIAKVVHHKESFGFEAGTAFVYEVNDRLAVKAGLQLNYRQYGVQAYRGFVPQTSNILLQQQGRFNSMVVVSDIQTYANGDPVDLKNRYLQFSVPVGFELSLAQFQQARFIMAATIQPTYSLNQRSWMISADYQRYVQEPSLMRNFNLNTGIEAFFRFNTKGNLNWQVGPQIRYQLLSSYVKEYPVQENLIDYGFKIGVSKTLR